MMDVSIIIVNYNTLKVTAQCLDSIFRLTCGLSFEVILVDNASTDGSKEIFSQDKRIKVNIYSDRNRTFGKANNLGVPNRGRRRIFSSQLGYHLAEQCSVASLCGYMDFLIM